MANHIILSRNLKNKSFYSHDSEKVHLWVHLLLSANWKEKEEMLGGKPYVCKCGEFTTGRKQLSEQTGINESKIERLLTYFEKIEQQIEQRKTSTNRLISILNWSKFQTSEQPFEQQVNNDRTTSEQQVNTLKEYKEDNNSTIKEDNKVFNFKKSLLELGVDKNVLDDWIKVRKLKKCSNTETAFNSIKKEIELSTLSPNECILKAVEKSWGGFEAKWISNIKLQNENNKSNMYLGQNQDYSTKF